ncbi:YrhB domain-containing protein [Undibacterium sp. Di26W]|uniref:YrhB domain-containing protein n=1 Tax=Undibacterium sp. Di26W TaxID=3413035 RepID=UPI003BF05D45
MIFNPDIIDELRKRRTSGEKPSVLLKYIRSEYPDDRGLGFTAIKYFRIAFDLSLKQVLPIPDWVNGGLSDETIDAYLLKELTVFIQSSEIAEQVALAFLENGPFANANPKLIATKPQEFDEGWIFLYQSTGYIRTGDFSDMLVGNPPIFVPRNGTPARHVSYFRPIEEMLAAFRYSGNTDAKANAQIRLFDWKQGALTISAIRAIRQHSSLGLGVAKKAIDDCLAGNASFINTSSVASARDLVSVLLKAGFIAEITYGD